MTDSSTTDPQSAATATPVAGPGSDAETATQAELAARGSNRSRAPKDAAGFMSSIMTGWAPRPDEMPEPSPAAEYTARRRTALGAAFPGERLVIPAGELRVRSNDTDYRFRAHSAFIHLTGLEAEEEPDAVLVLDPVAGPDGPEAATGAPTHEATLYFAPDPGRVSEEFFSNSRYGEFWVGRRPTLAEMSARTGLSTAHIDELADALAKDAGPGHVQVRVVRQASQAVEAQVQEVRRQSGLSQGQEAEEVDAALAEFLSELRLVKDAYEVGEMRKAVDATIEGFAEVVRQLPRATAHPRGERVVETAFFARAREDGNGLGYDTIAAAGPHGATLHYITNDGPVHEGDMLLLDAGVEVDSLYTADVTRTLPVTGRFTDAQRRVYQAVLDASDAAFAAAATPGAYFRDVHDAAIAVIAARVAEWGLVDRSAEELLAPDGQQHRRWMVHGTSHHLGLDVHDCAQARREMYLDRALEPGMCFTIEPGLYFHRDDLTVPEELRGMAVRIEDDVLVTEDGVENLSAALPRTPDEVEAWMASLRA